jgi:excinuclease ABC subunit C
MKKLLENLEKISLRQAQDQPSKNKNIRPHFWKSLPETPGVYVYFNVQKVIYIGKAINLKRRVGSYFDLNLEPKTERMISEATHVSYIQVASELESLLLEARLIRAYMPYYNVAAKDDKHPLYIQITKEKYPRITTSRKADLDKMLTLATYGPFPNSTNVKSVLRLIRRIFPYSDHKLGKRGCLYSHLGLCNPCPNNIEASPDPLKATAERNLYTKNVKNIKSILDGNISSLTKKLAQEMKHASEKENYEEALFLRNKIQQLEYITTPHMPTDYYIENPNLYDDTKQKELKQIKTLLSQKNINVPVLQRIECFDIAHLAGSSATASMVTFIDAEADKNYYRHFRIKKARGGDDYGSLGEIAKRRAYHFGDINEKKGGWGKPDLIIVDGGVGQVKAFKMGLSINYPEIPVVGIAKHPDRLVIVGQTIKKIKLEGAALNLVTRMRDEAHRFARRYHHKLVSKTITSAG